jgi:two-component system cell cycle sensor histidine kinase/response regulator CckA
MAVNVLLVDDNGDLLRMLRVTLEMKGFVVYTAGDGATALQLAEGRCVDVLVTDVVMPGMNGGQLAAQLLYQKPDLRVLFISGYHEEDVSVPNDARCRFLRKPFSGHALVDALHEMLALRYALG